MTDKPRDVLLLRDFDIAAHISATGAEVQRELLAKLQAAGADKWGNTRRFFPLELPAHKQPRPAPSAWYQKFNRRK